MKTLKTISTLVLAILFSVQINAFGEKVKGNGNLVDKSKTTAKYDKIAVGGSFDVTLVAGKEGNLTYSIESNLDEYLVIEVKNGTLKIKWKKGTSVRTTKTVKITVPFEDINEVSLAGSGEIVSKDTIEAENLELNVAGSGDMNVDVKTASLDASIAGSGSIIVNGSSKSMNGSIAGSGDIEGFGLMTDSAETSISGSGSIEATVNESLKARISGSGNVRYKGNPTTDAKVSGSGDVSKR